MRYLVIAILFLISLILQSTIFSHLTVAGVKPDLVLIMTVFYALLHGSREGAIAGAIGGLLQDLMFGQNVGMNALAKIIVGYVFGSLEKKIYKENILIPMAIIFMSTLMSETVLYLLRQYEGISGGYFGALRSVIISAAIYNSCLTPFLYGRFYKSSTKGLLRVTER
ncbi:rod shape-determining protein MreD [Phosphitispora sp. TUW77]|uniref:rod shape-determining protein MreD n=1 Tax=Phosphitispora sp. TUW77 TaxID=3152361 RepID=UPI003AB2F327